MARNDLPGVAEAEYEKAIKKFRGSVEEKIKAWKGKKPVEMAAFSSTTLIGKFTRTWATLVIEPHMGCDGGRLVRLRERSEFVRAIGDFFCHSRIHRRR